MRVLYSYVRVVAAAILSTSAIWTHQSRSSTYRDPTGHDIRFVTVDKDGRLEVLDWGAERVRQSCYSPDRGVPHTSTTTSRPSWRIAVTFMASRGVGSVPTRSLLAHPVHRASRDQTP